MRLAAPDRLPEARVVDGESERDRDALAARGYGGGDRLDPGVGEAVRDVAEAGEGGGESESSVLCGGRTLDEGLDVKEGRAGGCEIDFMAQSRRRATGTEVSSTGFQMPQETIRGPQSQPYMYWALRTKERSPMTAFVTSGRASYQVRARSRPTRGAERKDTFRRFSPTRRLSPTGNSWGTNMLSVRPRGASLRVISAMVSRPWKVR